jgi:hypothetical protein
VLSRAPAPCTPATGATSTGVSTSARRRDRRALVHARPQRRARAAAPDEVVVRITATPTRPADGPQLASEVVQGLVPYAAGASDNEQVSVQFRFRQL